MKVCILGATGNTGTRLVARALAEGHAVTAVVRNAGRAADLRHEHLTVREIDFGDATALREVMRGQDVVINAAGYLTDSESFTPLVQRIITSAEAALGSGGRFWMFAGAVLLDVPGTGEMTLDLPAVPQVYEAHRSNYRAVRGTKLDWSVLCPGPMMPSPDGRATEGLVVSAEVWPVARPACTRFLPRIASTLAFKQAVPRLTIYYEDAARVVLDNLAADSPFSRRRVGVALPQGRVRHKGDG
jgi:uncharacterized protein